MTGRYITKRETTLHLRKRVPSDLLSVLGRSEIHRTLRTVDKRQAQLIAKTIHAKLELAFANLRHQRLIGIPEERIRDSVQAILTQEVPTTRRQAVAASVAPPRLSGGARILSHLIETFKADRKSQWTPKTSSMRAAVLRLFVEIVGDKAISMLTRDDCRTFRDTVAQLPPNLIKRFRDQSLSEVIAKGLSPMSSTSVNKYVTTITAFLNWAVEEERVISSNPSRGLKVGTKQHPDAERDAYSQSELKMLFEESPLYKGCASLRQRHLPGSVIAKDAKWWLPLIALYSGMCLEEIAQLGPSHIRAVEDIWCFDVNAEEDRKLKTAYRPRLIPIHPVLIRLGILEYVAERSTAASNRLWLDLQLGADGFYGSSFSKWFGRFKRKIGIKNPKLTFHSFRHTFINYLKQKGAEEAWIKELVGHANDSITTGRYGKRLEISTLLSLVERIDYGLSHPSEKAAIE